MLLLDPNCRDPFESLLIGLLDWTRTHLSGSILNANVAVSGPLILTMWWWLIRTAWSEISAIRRAAFLFAAVMVTARSSTRVILLFMKESLPALIFYYAFIRKCLLLVAVCVGEGSTCKMR